MKRHSEIIQQIYAEGSNCLENLVVDAKKIEEEWQYNDFEQKVFGALPALLRWSLINIPLKGNIFPVGLLSNRLKMIFKLCVTGPASSST